MCKISVIVPVYNVRNNLEKCVDSIIGQTYKDFEVLLIDDGSTDGSAELCVTLSKKDKRINYYCMEHTGVSAIRNKGVNLSRGKYIIFVDSDDWIDSDMFEVLYNAAVKYNVPFVECSFRWIYNDSVKEETENTNKIIVADSYYALECQLNNKYFRGFMCDKLIKKELFHNIQFPENRIHEDEFTMYRLFFEAKRLVYIDSSKYNYNQIKKDRITSEFKEQNLDVVDAFRERLMFFYEIGNDKLISMIENHYHYLVLDRLYKCYKHKIYTKRVKEIIRQTNGEYFGNMAKPISANYKYELSLLYISYRLFCICREDEKINRFVRKHNRWFCGNFSV